MAVYVTKSMLSKFKKSHPYVMAEDNHNNSEHWQKLSMDSKLSSHLAQETICRICAKSDCSTPLTERMEECDILGAIRSVAGINVTTDDSLPKYICANCLMSLKVAYRFKRECEQADRRFKAMLNPRGDPSMHSYPYSKHDFQLILQQMKSKRRKYEEYLAKKQQKKEVHVIKPKKKEIKCSYCNITFPDKDKLFEHRRERQCMRRACDICGKLVLSISQHMRLIHKQAGVHRCSTCGKTFPILARLKSHMLIHSNTFKFCCDLCDYKCKHKYYLVMHMRTHTGEKPYKCPVCPATFVNPSNLNKHKLTHQEKQFQCALCPKAFRTNTALREHHSASHMNIKHTCSLCLRGFCYKSDLRKHEIRMHNREKRNYVGGEPSYKQAERIQRSQNMEPITEGQQSYKQVESMGPQRATHESTVTEATSIVESKWHPELVDVKWQQSKLVDEKWRQQDQGDTKWQQPVQLVATSEVVQVNQGLSQVTNQVVGQVTNQNANQVPSVSQAVYAETPKEYVVFYPDVINMLSQHTNQINTQQAVQLTMSDINLKKDDEKIYETPQMGYF